MAHVIRPHRRPTSTPISRRTSRSRLLRFITCGSVDDGKSTLIGRLLYDSKLIFEDQLAALEADSKKVGTQGGEIDFALLVDGLAAEREQGITIDVAYRFFSTDKRKFIVADTPGHEQYTRNMVTGASTADLAVILIDARKGVLTQTRRHSLPGQPDRHPPRRAGGEQDGPGRLRRRRSSTRIVADYRAFAAEIGLTDITRHPDLGPERRQHHLAPATATPWYDGPTLMQHLETRRDRRGPAAGGPLPHAGAVGQPAQPRLPRLLRPDRRRRWSRPGDRGPGPALGPRKHASRASSPRTATSTQAVAGQSVTLTLADEVDCSRGDVIAAADAPPEVADQFEATIVWMAEEPHAAGPALLAEDRRPDGLGARSPSRSTRSTSTRSSTWPPSSWS